MRDEMLSTLECVSLAQVPTGSQSCCENSNSIFKKKCPMHIKGALIYNHLLKKLNLTKKYPLILEGEKIKYLLLKTPNRLQANVIAFLGAPPFSIRHTTSRQSKLRLPEGQS